MPLDLLIALTVFSSVMAFTPGPNTIMLAASGVNFGFSDTIPHMIGVTVGFTVLLTACAAGLGAVFVAVPQLHVALKVVGALDHPHSLASTTRRCLYQNRVADLVGFFRQVLGRLIFAEIAWYHGNTGTGGDLLGLDLRPMTVMASGALPARHRSNICS